MKIVSFQNFPWGRRGHSDDSKCVFTERFVLVKMECFCFNERVACTLFLKQLCKIHTLGDIELIVFKKKKFFFKRYKNKQKRLIYYSL